jgi:uncharacterized protein YutE (UPF0331/DUF86 family)
MVAELIEEDNEDEEEAIATEQKLEETPNPISKQKETVAKQISFEDMLVHDYQELDFVKVDDVPVAVEQANEATFEALSTEIEPINETEPTSIVAVISPLSSRESKKKSSEADLA